MREAGLYLVSRKTGVAPRFAGAGEVFAGEVGGGEEQAESLDFEEGAEPVGGVIPTVHPLGPVIPHPEQAVTETLSQQGRQSQRLTVSRAGSLTHSQSAGQGASMRLNCQQGRERQRDSTVSRAGSVTETQQSAGQRPHSQLAGQGASQRLIVSRAGSVTHSQQGRECQRDSQSAGQRVSERLTVSRAASVRETHSQQGRECQRVS